MEIIKLEHIAKEYQGVEIGNAVHVLSDVNLRIHQGEFVAIVGPSGAGKSTTFNILGCLEQATAGKYFFKGRNITQLNEVEAAKLRNKEVGFVFQTDHLLKRYNVYENVALPLSYAGIPKKEWRIAVKVALRRVHLLEKISLKTSELSRAELQRVALARALVTRPSFVLADEPTGSLNQTANVELMHLFTKLHQEGTTVILVTHDYYVAKYASRTIEILDGKIKSWV